MTMGAALHRWRFSRWADRGRRLPTSTARCGSPSRTPLRWARRPACAHSHVLRYRRAHNLGRESRGEPARVRVGLCDRERRDEDEEEARIRLLRGRASASDDGIDLEFRLILMEWF